MIQPIMDRLSTPHLKKVCRRGPPALALQFKALRPQLAKGAEADWQQGKREGRWEMHEPSWLFADEWGKSYIRGRHLHQGESALHKLATHFRPCAGALHKLGTHFRPRGSPI